MKKLYIVFLLLLSHIIVAQDISGYWQGVDYSPKSATSAYWASLLSIQQNGNAITGKLYQYAPNKPQYFLEVEVTGTFQNDKFQIKTGKVIRDKLPPGTYWCVNGQGTFIYNAAEESLKGTLFYANCQSHSSTFELYAVKPKTKLSYCKDEKIVITVTGQNVKWYDSEQKNKLLGKGNTFEPKISQTTTFYATQTHYNTESPAAPITIEINDPKIADLDARPTTCGLANGVLKASASGDGSLTYSIDSQNFQSSNLFENLAAKNYTLTVKDKNGCVASQSVAIKVSDKPVISNLVSVPTTCGLENGSITVVATGGKAPLQYSYEGVSFSPAPNFDQLKAGNYSLKVKDADGCEDTKSVTIAPSQPIKITQVIADEATCEGNDGELSVLVSGGQVPFAFSIDSASFQPKAVLQNLKAGEYTIFVKDADDCLARAKAKVSSNCADVVHFPDAFSPNGDGINDAFTLYFTGNALKVIRFVVYNRWGSAVFASSEARAVNNGESLWDGKVDGVPANPGLYQYLIEMESDKGRKMTAYRAITLIR